jgi:hypothetical protein
MAVEWGSQASLLGGAVEWGTQENELLVVEPTITSITGTIAAGSTITLNLAGFEAAPTSVTIGGIAVTINSATTASASVTLLTRQTLALAWGASYTITASNAGPESASVSRTLAASAGWQFGPITDIPPDASDSLYRMRRDDLTEPFTASVGDQFQWQTAAGLTINELTEIFLAEGTTSASSAYSIFDVSLGARLPEHLFGVVEIDGTPNPYSFTNTTDATASSTVTSNTLTLTGFNVPILVSVENGLISVNGGTFTAADTELEPGQTLALRGTASASSLGVTSVVVTAGGVSRTWTITTQEVAGEDTTPDAFSFTDVTSVALNSVQTSNEITVSGINAASPISIVGGTYSINGGTYTSVSGTVTNGQAVTVRLTASASFSTATNATLTIGTVSDTFTATTLVEDTAPDPFDFDDVSNADLSTEYTSDPITVSGINSAAPISVTGGTYSINGGSFTSSPGTVTNGQQVRARLTSSPDPETGVVATVTIGGISGGFTVTTAAAVEDYVPDAFSFVNRSSATESTPYVSNAVTPIGYNMTIPVTVVGGNYSVNGGSYVSTPGTISPGQTLRLQTTSAAGYPGSTSVTVTVGGVEATWTVTNYSSAPGGGSTYYGLKGVLKGELKG